MNTASICFACYAAAVVLVPIGASIYNRIQTDQSKKISFMKAIMYGLFWPVAIPAHAMSFIAVLYDKFSNID